MSDRLRTDVFVLALLGLLGALLGLPVLGGGYLTYLDTPVHLAELISLADPQGNGWSTIGFCGFPLHILHSPLWYGSASLLHRAGVPAGPLLAGLTWLGFIAPAVAIYLVARRRAAAVWAALPAVLLLTQRSPVAGIASAWGGMWTFWLATGFLIVLLDRLCDAPSPRRRLWIATLSGLIGLTHLFITMALVIATVAYAVLSARDGLRGLRRVAADIGALALGAVASAAYWLPLLTGGSGSGIEADNAPAWAIWRALALPGDLLEIFRSGGEGVLRTTDPYFLLPTWTLLVLGLVGAAHALRRRNALGMTGVLFALVLLVLLTVVLPGTSIGLLGPVSWRLVFLVPVALALASVPLLGELDASQRSRQLAVSAVLIVLVVGPLSSRQLAQEVAQPGSERLAPIADLWSWLEESRDESWRRVYLQDTFSNRPDGDPLSNSHVLALTAARTGVEQIGAYYRVVPFPSRNWVRSEYGRLFGHRVQSDRDVDALVARMRASATSHLVLVDPDTAAIVGAHTDLDVVFRSGYVTAFALRGPPPGWAEAMQPGVGVAVRDREVGEMGLLVRSPAAGATVVIKESYSPYWRVEGVEGVSLDRLDPSGFIVTSPLDAGESQLRLRYEPPQLPIGLTVVGWLGILLLLVRTREKAKDSTFASSQRVAQSAPPETTSDTSSRSDDLVDGEIDGR